MMMILFLGFIILSLLHFGSSSTTDVHYESYNCLPESSSYAANSTFQRNLNYTLFTQLVANASLHAPSSTFQLGEGSDRVFAFYYCRPDFGAQVCHSCVANAATKVLAQCNLLKQGIVWYDECSLCYGGDSSVFRNDYENVYYPKYNSTPDLGDYLEQYRNLYNSTITDLIDQAARNVSLSFATKTVNLSSSQSLRGIVQCGPIISGESCKECLNAAYVKMTQDWTNTMMFLPACYVGFELYGSRPPLLPLPSSSTLSVSSKVLIALLCPVGFLLVLGCGFWFWKHKHSSARDSSIQDNVELIESERQQIGLVQYSYYQLEEMTSGFNKKLGEGGFATVYYGRLSDGSTEVAVKVFTKNEAPVQFNTEINVLGGISHKNLVSLIGYCEDGTILALIYEFMDRGDLKSLLFEQSEALSWRKRLEIAIDVAQGLDYLHNGCCPAIVHRDVKPANILLNNKLRAKVADFGFSKIFPMEYVSNLQTRVVGTPGYLDPQYNLTGQLNEKGDVYSYGVVLLELITGKPAIALGTNLGVWVKSMVERGDIVSILDARLRQDVDNDYVTVWKTVELAVRCIGIEGADRPKMAEIVTELKDAWHMLITQISSSATNSTERMSGAVYSSSSVMSPSPR